MQQDWQLRRDHDFHVELAHCRSSGLPEPQLIEGGYKRNTPLNTLMRRFHGKKFWKIMDELEHDSTEFHKCRCSGG